MGVVIDDFEVVVGDPRPAPADEAGAAAPAGPSQSAGSGMSPEDVRFVVERRDARAARIFAH